MLKWPKIILLLSPLIICGVVFYADNARATVLGEVYGPPSDLSPIFTPTHVYPVSWAAAVGDTVNFNVDKSFDFLGRAQLQATLKITSAKAYLYVEDAYFSSLSIQAQSDFLAGLQNLANEFDNNIYPKETAFFGLPWEPGIDNDSHITILVSHLAGNFGGYFRTDDEYPRSQVATSNEREMVFINAVNITNAASSNSVRNFLAHEFQHLISFYQKTKLLNSDDDVWLNELRSEYAPTVAGFNDVWSGSYLQSRVGSFLTNPSDSLNEWKNATADYAAINVFAHYLADQYGSSIISKSLQRPERGIVSIDATLADMGLSDKFGDIFLNWEIANYINSPTAGTRYTYKNPNLTFKLIAPSNIYTVDGSLNFNVVGSIKDWAGRWDRINSSTKSLKISFSPSVSSYIFKVASIIVNKNETYEVRNMSLFGSQAEVIVNGMGTTVDHVIFVPASETKTSDFGNNEPTRSFNLSMATVEPANFSVNSVSPSVVYAGGGAIISVSGSNFVSGMTVSVNGISVAATLVSSSTINFVMPQVVVGNVCLLFASPGSASIQNCSLLRVVSYAEGSLIRARGDYKVWIVKSGWRRHIVNSEIFSFYPHLGFTDVIDVDQSELDAFKLSAWVRVPLTQDSLTWRVYEVNDDATKHWITCADPNNCAANWLAHGGNPDGIYTINQSEMNYYSEGPKVFLQ
ncbi:MAG: hypothetical protein A3A80_01170 [Candidatus Terrybacteria bacterium RIFCSPLOWO2_01_FULL_44_24]|uniref:IPT/TIG domain-containing protein n=1 Tax=Candidatus Terrybacteria bacterium RIFCSPHIGHO2_01_FULL_43_35 TaxID=1802361 RepID=A0A1G2PFA8_9BACT|nr:MAG: hypothetical protein A2828_03550 [Candidatus Terrybacteria bacterium RIFCSPHIGHO2_01_FULL_43_35]OHA50405.1 MAG: hypothetical protein A3B75_02615 [Candidatus Terrybacteria bacterium RIFCSPHIGHO2_02_FULL_43_14]OHA51694.1 MAG: hypothetical protein A3A80_01170 [Candidatus Terrybacteria bacterium RIFCSPLOWO2_01_FULL_44_24]